jgi:serine/threonine-protein kinase RsbT
MSTERRIYVNNDLDIAVARMQAREMAKEMGFSTVDQARISLAASELARVLSWNPHDPGEIVMSGADRNGHLGLQVDCVVDLETMGDPPNPQQNESLAGACRLVDESIVEAQDDKYTRVTLIKWLK